MLIKELSGQPQPVAAGPIGHHACVDAVLAVTGVAVDQPMILVGGQPGHRSCHRVPLEDAKLAWATAYSAARCSADRCT
jgi:hypothetical protein